MSTTTIFRPSNLTTGLQAYWKLDEASGTRADSSGNGNTLTDNNTVASVAQSYWNTETSADFETSNSEYLSITDGAQTGLDLTSGFSFACWIKLESLTPTRQVIISKHNAVSAGYLFEYATAGFRLYVNSTPIQGATTPVAGKWYHVACTWDSTTKVACIYLDGNIDAIGTINVTLADGTDAVEIGRLSDSTEYLDGLLKDLAAWSVILTPAQIKSLALGIDISTDTLRPDSDQISAAPTSYWPLNEISNGSGAVTRVDAIGPNNLTDVNTTQTGPGYMDGAADIESVDGNYLEITDGSQVGLDITSSYSVCFWVKPEATVGGSWVNKWSPNTGWNIQLTTGDGGTIQVNHDAANYALKPAGFLTVGYWYHVAVVYDDANDVIRGYVDGKIIDTLPATTNPSNSTNPFRIGRRGDGSDQCDGQICDVAVWNGTVLTDADIKLLASGLPIQQTGIVSYWKMDEEAPSKLIITGNDTEHDTAQSKFGGSSALFDGTTDYLEVDHHPDFLFGTGNFTIDFWVRWNAAPAATYFFDKGTYPSNALQIAWNGANLEVNTSQANSVAWSPSSGTWYHIAVVRSGGNDLRAYINGTLLGSWTDATNFNNTESAYIGANSSGPSQSLNGWMDEFRISSVARWTTNFTPEVAAYTTDGLTVLLLHFDGTDGTTYFIDSSADKQRKAFTATGNAQIDTAQSKFGGASALFDGASDYVSTLASKDFVFGATEFTIDCWIRFNTVSAARAIFAQGTDGSNYLSFYWDTGAPPKLKFFCTGGGGSGTFSMERDWTPSTATWYHVAIIRTGNTMRMFIDGTQLGADYSATGLATGTFTGGVNVGGDSINSRWHDGWLDEVRVSRGIARWTGNFTPEIAAYTADQYDVLLLHMDGADASTTFTDDAGTVDNPAVRADSFGPNDLTDTNTVQAVVGKVDKGAYFQSANSEYLSIADGSQVGLDITRDFTIGFWYKPSSNGVIQEICNKGADVSTYAVRRAAANQFSLICSNVSTTGTSTTTVGQWHFVIARVDGATHRIYVNSILETSTASAALATDTASDFKIGTQVTPASYADGVIDEFVILSRWLRDEEIKAVYILGNTDQAADASPTPPVPPTQAANSGNFLTFRM